jgi:hypothetical protein
VCTDQSGPPIKDPPDEMKKKKKAFHTSELPSQPCGLFTGLAQNQKRFSFSLSLSLSLFL